MLAKVVLSATRSPSLLLQRKRRRQEKDAEAVQRADSPKGEAKTVANPKPGPRPQMGDARPSRSGPAASQRDPKSGKRTWCATSIHEERTCAAAPKMDATSNTEASALPKSLTVTNGKRNS